jgi:hypothetical protein
MLELLSTRVGTQLIPFELTRALPALLRLPFFHLLLSLAPLHRDADAADAATSDLEPGTPLVQPRKTGNGERFRSACRKAEASV